MITDPLLEFARFYFANPQALPPSVWAGVTFVGDFAQLVMERSGDYQVQLCLCRPDSVIPDHSHPNVDTFVVYVTGQIFFRLDGQVVIEPQAVKETPRGGCSHNAHHLRVMPGQSHGAAIGPVGGAFLTVQRWLNGKPTSVERDWEGPPL